MRKILLFLAAIFTAAAPLLAQPGQRIALTNLQKATVVESSRAGQFGLTNSNGDQRYAQFTEIDLTPIGYTPTATGNTQNYSEFVTTANGDIWYIDWQGRAVRLYNAASGASDLDWLEIDTNTPPNNIRDSMYTYSYASFNARMVWPGANVFVNDSINSADVVIQGNRQARLSLFNMLNQAWTVYALNGAEASVLLGGGANAFKVATATGSPTGPAAGVNHFQVNAADSTVQMYQYPSSRRDPDLVENFLYTDPSGIVRSQSLGVLPGATYAFNDPLCNPPSITPDPILGPLFASNEDCGQQWHWTGIEWVIDGDPGGGGVAADSTFRKTDGSYLNKTISSNVYKNGTLGIGTTDTTGMFNINEPSDASNKPRINLLGNGLWLWKTAKDTRAVTPVIQDFYMGRSFFSNVSSAGDNQVYNFVINYSPVGGHVSRYQNAAGWVIENNYKNSPAEPGSPGFGFYEFQWPEVVYSDTVIGTGGIKYATGVPDNTKRRMLAGYASNQKPSNGGYIGFTSDVNTYYDWKTGVVKATWGFAENSLAPKGITFQDTASITFQRNNTGGIFYRNAANNANLGLFKVDNLNRVVLGFQNVNTLYTEGQIFNSIGPLTIAPLANQSLTLGTSATTSDVTISTQGAMPLTLKTAGNTSGYGFLADNFSWELRDLSNASTTMVRIDRLSPANSIYVRGTSGNVGLGDQPDFDISLHVKKTSLGASSKLFGIENSTGKSSFFRSNATPEGAITAGPGDIAITNISSNGRAFLKNTGTGNTGWTELVTAANISTYATVPTLQQVTTVSPSSYITNHSVRVDSLIRAYGNESTFAGFSMKNPTTTTGRDWLLRSMNNGEMRITRDGALRAKWSNTLFQNFGRGMFGPVSSILDANFIVVDSTVAPVYQVVQNKMGVSTSDAILQLHTANGGGDAGVLLSPQGTPSGYFAALGTGDSLGTVIIGQGGTFGANTRLQINPDGRAFMGGGVPTGGAELTVNGDLATKHLVGNGLSPSNALTTASGTASCVIAGTDLAFQVQYTSSATPTAGDKILITLTSPLPGGMVPNVVIQDGDANGFQSKSYVNQATRTPSTFEIVLKSGVNASTLHKFGVIVVGSNSQF